jgi:hypothetical protein
MWMQRQQQTVYSMVYPFDFEQFDAVFCIECRKKSNRMQSKFQKMMSKKKEGAVGLMTLALAVIALFPMAMVQALRQPMIGEWGYDPSDYWTL